MSQRPPTSTAGTQSGAPESTPGWTDYLHVGIPLIAIVCLIGLFWYWTDSLIRDESTGSAAPTAIAAVTGQQAETDESAEPTSTSVVAVIDVGPTPTPIPESTEIPVTEPPTPTPEPIPEIIVDDTPTPIPPTGGDLSLYAVGDTVVVGTDDLRLRDAPSINGAVIATLDRGTVLEVIGPGQETDNYTWVEVQEPDSGTTGYVADQFLEAAN